MKKRFVSFILAVVMLMSFGAFSLITRATIFSDVPDKHWAERYITHIQGSDIINGYEDGTFKPEQNVKIGEFIKMIIMAKWPIYPMEELPEGTHWATPYGQMANNIFIWEPAFDYERYEKYITREEAVVMIWKLYTLLHENVVADTKEQYIKLYSDEALIKDEYTRLCFNSCMQYGLINGYEDGTIKPNETLTRAQAAKLLYLAISE